MTRLTKVVRRVTVSCVRDKGSKRRELVVSLLPGDVLEFRPKGTRYRISIPIEYAYRHAERQNALAKAAERRGVKS